MCHARSSCQDVDVVAGDWLLLLTRTDALYYYQWLEMDAVAVIAGRHARGLVVKFAVSSFAWHQRQSV